MTDTLKILSVVAGWSYFAAWSASFYPQALLHYRRQSVEGLSIDSCILSVLGHISYLVYNVTLYFSESVQHEYRIQHDGANNTVQLNDVAFSVHATCLALLILWQTLYYPRELGQRLSDFNRAVVFIYLIVLGVNAFALSVQRTESLYDFVNILALFRLYVSVAKNIPQAWRNYCRQSTAGFSIEGVLLNLSGGVLCFVQLFTDAVRTSAWTSITGNPAKFGLSLLTLIFTSLYIVQHYVLYPDHHDDHLTKDVTCFGTSVLGDRSGVLPHSRDRTPLLGP